MCVQMVRFVRFILKTSQNYLTLFSSIFYEVQFKPDFSFEPYYVIFTPVKIILVTTANHIEHLRFV